MSDNNISTGPLFSGHLTTSDIADDFEGFIDNADADVEKFITDHSTDGTLEMSASESLELQQLMADQSIAAQTGTSTLKGVKDSIVAAARNI